MDVWEDPFSGGGGSYGFGGGGPTGFAFGVTAQAPRVSSFYGPLDPNYEVPDVVEATASTYGGPMPHTIEAPAVQLAPLTATQTAQGVTVSHQSVSPVQGTSLLGPALLIIGALLLLK